MGSWQSWQLVSARPPACRAGARGRGAAAAAQKLGGAATRLALQERLGAKHVTPSERHSRAHLERRAALARAAVQDLPIRCRAIQPVAALWRRLCRRRCQRRARRLQACSSSIRPSCAGWARGAGARARRRWLGSCLGHCTGCLGSLWHWGSGGNGWRLLVLQLLRGPTLQRGPDALPSSLGCLAPLPAALLLRGGRRGRRTRLLGLLLLLLLWPPPPLGGRGRALRFCSGCACAARRRRRGGHWRARQQAQVLGRHMPLLVPAVIKADLVLGQPAGSAAVHSRRQWAAV